jgi:adenylate cyclase class 2
MSDNNLVETEVKLYVPDLAAVAARLASAGAELESPRVFERNVRYENARGSFTEESVVLRLREDTRVRLTYKEAPRAENGIVSRFEAEVTVDDFDTMDLILRRLGFRPYVVYEKYRATYRFGDTEVVLDEMPYGPFVEIEGPPAAIESALAALELTASPRITLSYLALFERVKAALRLPFDDLTFANFVNVTVPPELFYR